MPAEDLDDLRCAELTPRTAGNPKPPRFLHAVCLGFGGLRARIGRP